MKIFWLVILPMLLCSLPDVITAIPEIKQLKYLTIFDTLLPKAVTIIKDVYKLWDIFLRDPDIDITSVVFRNKEQEMLEHLITISSKITNLEDEIKEISDTTITKILQAFPEIVKLELNMHELKLIINQINFAEEQMENYLILGYNKIKLKEQNVTSQVVSNQNSSQSNINVWDITNKMLNSTTKIKPTHDWKIERYTLENFASWATDHSFNSLLSLLRRLNDLIVPKENDGLFNLILQVSKLMPLLGGQPISALSLLCFKAVFVHVANTNDTYIKSRSKLPDISLIDNTREAIINTFKSLWRNLIESNDVNHNVISDLTLLREYERIHESIKQTEDFINTSDYYLFASDWSYALIDGEITNVNTFYETFIRFQEENLNGMKKPQIAWTDLAETYIQNSDFGIIKSLEKIHRYAATETESENLFKKIQKDARLSTCNLRQSLHQTLYNLYNSITVAELKGNVILQFSYMILQMYDKGNFTEEATLSLQNYQKYAKQKIEVVKKALSRADRSFYKCDPMQYVEGVTHTKLTRLLQGYIENEVNLNPYGTCRENCQYYTYTEYNGCFKNQFCAHQPQCRGKVIDCRYVDSDMHICTSTNPERRYDWVEYENGKILGNKGVCEKKNLFSVDSWWRYLFWHCSYCLCLCDDINQGSDRYFNLRDVVSDIEKNKVVTGLRIVKQNQIVHLQIQQGVLTPFGVIDKTTLSWKPVENYTVDDDNVENNVDYYTMSWLERAVDTDEVFGPPEHVVTGLRLRKIGTHLNLEVRVTPINFTSGEVYKADHSYWLGNDNTDVSQNHPRTEIELVKPDIPIRNGPHTLNSKHDQYIQFQPTSFDTDVAQTTVPYLDSQALTSEGFPLSGIGLIHRGKLGSGGFIAPKLISYDFTPHLGSNNTD